MYCRAKAEGWRGKNPLSPAVLELEIKRLLHLKAAYEGYRDVSFSSHPPPISVMSEMQISNIATQGTMAADPEPAENAEEESNEAKKIKELNTAQAKLDGLKKADPVVDASVTAADTEVKKLKKELSELQKVSKNKNIVKALDTARSKGMKTSLGKKIADLEKEITSLRGHLAECNAGFQRDVNAIVGVEEKKKKEVAPSDPPVTQEAADPELQLVMANERPTGADRDLLSSGSQPVEAPDPWTKIVFTSSTSSESSDSSEKSMSAEAKLKIGGLFWGLQASTSVSDASKYVFAHPLLGC